MKFVAVALLLCALRAIDAGNSALIERNDNELQLPVTPDLSRKSYNNNHSNGRTRDSRIDGQLLAKVDRNARLVVRKPANNRLFIGRIIIPYIICFFAAKGFWPFFPSFLQYQVNDMGKKVFSLSDDHIRSFCRGKFDFQDKCHRPMIFRGLFIPFGMHAARDIDLFNCTWETAWPPTGPPPTTVPTPPVTVPPTTPPPVTTPPPTTPPPPPTTTTPMDVETITPPGQICNCSNSGNGNVADGNHGIEDFDEIGPPTNVRIEIKNIFAFGMMGRSGNSSSRHDDKKH